MRKPIIILVLYFIAATSYAFDFGSFDFNFGGGQWQCTNLLPSPSFSPSSVAFGNHSTGTTSDSVVTLSNTGTATLSAAELAVSGTSFTLQSTTCGSNPFDLAAGADCTATVRFAPLTAAAFTGSLTMTAPNLDNLVASLSGTGITQYNPYSSASGYSASVADSNANFKYKCQLVNTGTHNLNKYDIDFHSISGNITGKTYYVAVISRTGSDLNLATGIKGVSAAMTGVSTAGIKSFYLDPAVSVVAGDNICIYNVNGTDSTNYMSVGRTGVNADSGYSSVATYNSSGVLNSVNSSQDFIYTAYEE